MRQYNSSTMVIGSQTWIDFWADWYWDKACKNADRYIKWNEEYYLHAAMCDMFNSYMWTDTQPWN